MSSTDHHQIESDLGRLAAEPSGAAPESFLGAVRARRRAVRIRRASAVVLGAIVVVAGVRFMPSPAPQPSGPMIVEDHPTDGDLPSPPAAHPSGAVTLASLRHLYTRPSGTTDLLAELPSTPSAARAEPPLRLHDVRLLLADGV